MEERCGLSFQCSLVTCARGARVGSHLPGGGSVLAYLSRANGLVREEAGKVFQAEVATCANMKLKESRESCRMSGEYIRR